MKGKGIYKVWLISSWLSCALMNAYYSGIVVAAVAALITAPISLAVWLLISKQLNAQEHRGDE